MQMSNLQPLKAKPKWNEEEKTRKLNVKTRKESKKAWVSATNVAN